MDTDHCTLCKGGSLAISISTCLCKGPPASRQNKSQKPNKADYLSQGPDRGPARGSLGRGTWQAKDRHLLRGKLPALNRIFLHRYHTQRGLPPVLKGLFKTPNVSKSFPAVQKLSYMAKKNEGNSPALEYSGTKTAKLFRLKHNWCQNAHFLALVTVPTMC